MDMSPAQKLTHSGQSGGGGLDVHLAFPPYGALST